MNIVEPILYQCKLNPFGTAIATPGTGANPIKYGQLEQLIHNVARAALKAGLAPGDVAALFVAEPMIHAVLSLGLMRLGVVTMSLGEASLPANLKINAVITNTPQYFTDADNVIVVNASWLQGDGRAPDYDRIYRGNENDDCRIVLTSGSTGRSKGVAFTHKALAERIAHYRAKGPIFARISRLYSAFGISASPGFRLLMYMLSHGGTIYFTRTDEPAGILHYLDVYKIQGMVCSPHQLDFLLKFFEADSALSCSLDLVICQGARLSPQLAERARTRLCPNLYTSYGSTEVTTVACGPAQLATRTPGAVGFICPGVSVDIIDEDDRVLPQGREGIIRVRSTQMTRGYLGDPEATAQMFRDGAFYSGDLGYVTPDGVLAITGRQKTALLLSGESVAPEIIEEALCSFGGVDQAAVCALEDEAGIAEVHALIVSSMDIDEAALRAHCQSKLRPSFAPVRCSRVDAIPRGGQGKIDRPRVLQIAKEKMQLSRSDQGRNP